MVEEVEEIPPIEEEEEEVDQHLLHVIVMQLQLAFVEIPQQMLLLHVEIIKEMHVNQNVSLLHQELNHQHLQLAIVKDKQEHNVEPLQQAKQQDAVIMHSIDVK